ncbi:hypothetical protein FOZ60_013711 [Perkinsus olseni]|uniref:Uncharacterized protein n=1 Tax=Perkinsus olseni TaxID=32597 RepID=A0A7J6P870_PEROL|nr:hypothetical protein FOZ60_013711 [Perkinsus olseni]
MRLPILAVIISCALSAANRRGRDRRSGIMSPDSFQEYSVADEPHRCRITVKVVLRRLKRTYELWLYKRGNTGLKVLGSDGRGATSKITKGGRGCDDGPARQPVRSQTAKSGDLLERLSTVPGGLDGRDCNSRLSRVHRALALKSRKYRGAVGFVGAVLPSSFDTGQESFFGTSGEEEPRTAYALVKLPSRKNKKTTEVSKKDDIEDPGEGDRLLSAKAEEIPMKEFNMADKLPGPTVAVIDSLRYGDGCELKVVTQSDDPRRPWKHHIAFERAPGGKLKPVFVTCEKRSAEMIPEGKDFAELLEGFASKTDSCLLIFDQLFNRALDINKGLRGCHRQRRRRDFEKILSNETIPGHGGVPESL